MDEDEDNSTMSAITPSDLERPQTAHRDSWKVMGGFELDELDDLSPIKDRFDNDSVHAGANNNAFLQNNRVPSLDLAGLPTLPALTGDSSYLYSHSETDLHSEGNAEVDEKAVRKHLNDVESSFLPTVSPVGGSSKVGQDDTYLFDGAKSGGRLSPLRELNTPNEKPKTAAQPEQLSPTARSTPHAESDENGYTTPSLETMSSSPMAAAAARTVSRAISAATAGGTEPSSDIYNDDSVNLSEDEVDTEATPRKQRYHSDDLDDGSTIRHHLSTNSLYGDAGSTPGHALLNHRSNKRPKYLRSRHGSQRSSVSSFVSNSDHDEHESISETDYALQSGGAVPGLPRLSSFQLSRSISLGSMASALDDISPDSFSRVDGTLSTLTEEEQNRERTNSEVGSAPHTPKASSRTLAAPTDTIIARHVRNVQVPESVATEYRNQNKPNSPKRSKFSGSTIGRSGKNMTLKEQSSTIERLSKENFDLKLKVMFLSDRLDKLSEEGVKDMISENVELKTGLAVMQRDNKALRRKVKDLEKQLKDEKEGEGRPSTARSGTSDGGASTKWFDHEGAQEREEELVYLRERVEEYVTEIEKLRNESLQRENEKRNLAEAVRSMGERSGHNVEAREEMDVWKDLLEQETSRREQGDDEIKRLREEIFRLKTEVSTTAIPGLNHTTNIYNITKKKSGSRSGSPTRPQSGLSNHLSDGRNGAFSAGSTLVEEYRKETEQLRHENVELRKEVGAQTAMLTSRNREKDSLYAELEDLKFGLRRGTAGSVAGESIFERSASRTGPALQRPESRASGATRQTNMTDAERDEYDAKNAELRDKNNGLKLQNQDLQRELQSCTDDFETAISQKKQAEALTAELQDALEVAENDLVTMQSDRDEALHEQEDGEIKFEALRAEAQQEIDAYQDEIEEANAEIERLQGDLSDATENFNALQSEMRQMSESLVRLEDDHEHNSRRIQDLQKDLEELTADYEELQKNHLEANEKIDRLTVQLESSQNEIAFLREEQDGDKIRIGDLEALIKQAESSLQEEKGRTEELEQRLASERHQRDVVAGREKQEVQQCLNELNREASTAKDEARRLRKNLTSREVEVAEWKQRLMELESNLREALGDINGTRSSLLNSIAKLQRELEKTIREQDISKAALIEKERLIKQRDSLLESHSLESRKLADMLDKERQSHRTTKHQFETFQKTQQHTSRSLTQHESRVLELETSRQQDRRKLAALENTFKDQMAERNNLLLALWSRLSGLCGSEWTHNNNLINGRALPTIEAITTMLPGFAKNLLAAVKTIESLVSDFKTRIRSIEKDLWKEYQALESNLEVRTKRLDRLETLSRSAIPSAGGDHGQKAEVERLKELNKAMKLEISTLRAVNDVQSNAFKEHSPAPSIPTGPRNISSPLKSTDKSRVPTMTRHQSSSVVETISSSRSGSEIQRSNTSMGEDDYKPDLKWQVRLQELEYKLKAEREARKLDRTNARQRLEEKNREVAEAKGELERERSRRGTPSLP